MWRYYLLANRPETSDSAFLWSDLAAKNNNELLANLGNFINRTLSFVAARFGGVVPPAPEPAAAPEAVVADLGARAVELLGDYVRAMDGQHLKDGLRVAMALSKAGNLFFQSTEPWVVLKQARALLFFKPCLLSCARAVVFVPPVGLAPSPPLPPPSRPRVVRIGKWED